MALAAGTVIDSKYRVEQELARGGMGIVYLATHLHLGTTVALKLILSERANERECARLLREAKAAAVLRSPYAVRVTDAGMLPSGEPFLCMEYVPGRTLAARLASEGPVSVTLAVDYLLQVCDVLREAETIGLMHRDIKPSNLIVGAGASDELKVLDFGLAKHKFVDALALTDSDSLIGSPPYLAPECIRKRGEPDSRSDLWSVGVTLYECLCGERPFDGETPYALYSAILNDEPLPLREHGIDVPEGLQRVVERLLRKEPALRFQSATELSVALAPYASERYRVALVPRDAASSSNSGRSSATLTATACVDTGSAQLVDPVLAGAPAAGASPRRVTLVGGGALCAAALAALWLSSRADEPAPPTAASNASPTALVTASLALAATPGSLVALDAAEDPDDIAAASAPVAKTTPPPRMKSAVAPQAPAQHTTGQHPTGQHTTAQHPTGQHTTGQHPTGQHTTGQHPTGQHTTAQRVNTPSSATTADSPPTKPHTDLGVPGQRSRD